MTTTAGPFKNHVFISYTHIDNAHLEALPNGWIDAVHEFLQQRLVQLFDRSATIWRDSKLDGIDNFSTEISTELENSAILLSVVSPDYLRSKSALSELQQFSQAAARRDGPSMNRIVAAIKTYVPLEQRPIKDALGYEFFARDSARDQFREYNYLAFPAAWDNRFWEKLEDVAQDIARQLQKLMGPAAAASSGATVYLAETTIDLLDERASVRRELEQKGHLVLPDKPLPSDPETLKATIRAYLEQSCLSIYLVGGFYDTLVRIQHELAFEREAKPDFARLIWIPSGVQPLDEVQTTFIKNLRDNFDPSKGSELLEMKLEDLKSEIEEKLNPPVLSAASPATSDPDKPNIYLICDKADRDIAATLFNHLLWDRSFNPKVCLMEGDSSAIQEDRKQNLLMCDGVIICFGNVSDQWLIAQRDELRKLAGYGRTKPLCRAVYVTSPETTTKEFLQGPDPLIIKNFDAFKPECLDEFISHLQASKGVTQ